jgi:hypothetical protein
MVTASSICANLPKYAIEALSPFALFRASMFPFPHPPAPSKHILMPITPTLLLLRPFTWLWAKRNILILN